MGGLDDLPKKKEALDGGRRLRRALGRVGDRHHPHGDRRHGLRQDRRRCPAQIPRSKRGILFGMMLDPFGEADRAYMMRSLPGPSPDALPVLVERLWKKYAAALRTGT